MRYTFEEEFRLDHPETVGETDSHFDLGNYKDWLEAQLIEARKQLDLYNVVGQSEQLKPFHCPNCKQPWDTRLTNSCQCGASIKRF